MAAGAPTFRELVSRVRSTVLSAVANAALPFACVLQAAGVPSSSANAPVFTTALHMPDAAVGAAALDVLRGAGLEAKPAEACWPCTLCRITWCSDRPCGPLYEHMLYVVHAHSAAQAVYAC